MKELDGTGVSRGAHRGAGEANWKNRNFHHLPSRSNAKRLFIDSSWKGSLFCSPLNKVFFIIPLFPPSKPVFSSSRFPFRTFFFPHPSKTICFHPAPYHFHPVACFFHPSPCVFSPFTLSFSPSTLSFNPPPVKLDPVGRMNSTISPSTRIKPLDHA